MRKWVTEEWADLTAASQFVLSAGVTTALAYGKAFKGHGGRRRYRF